MSWNTDNWPEERCECLKHFHERITAMFYEANRSNRPLAWRGLGRRNPDCDWTLKSSLDRLLAEAPPNGGYSEYLKRERDILEEFRCRALPFASEQESTYLKSRLEGAAVWKVIALGRHGGLPTRALDWTSSPWVAAYFACIEHRDADGTICWFNQSQLEEVLSRRWGEWKVPTRAAVMGLNHLDRKVKERLGLHARVLEKTAFKDDGPAWITKIHYWPRFPRMEAQQAFMTVCGRIQMDHNDAIDALARFGTINRGRIIVSAALKTQVLELLKFFGVTAQSLQYPGIDIVARDIGGNARGADPQSRNACDHGRPV